MELQQPVSKTESEQPNGSRNSHRSSPTSTTTVASQGQSKSSKKSKITQPGTKLHENVTASSEARNTQSTPETVSRSSTGYTQDIGQETSPSYISLTIQALQVYNLQQAGSSQGLKYQPTSQQCNFTNSEAVDNAFDDPTYMIDVTGRDEYDRDSPSWNINSKQDPTVWGGDLAGVGEHLNNHGCQEYTGLIGFIEE